MNLKLINFTKLISNFIKENESYNLPLSVSEIKTAINSFQNNDILIDRYKIPLSKTIENTSSINIEIDQGSKYFECRINHIITDKDFESYCVINNIDINSIYYWEYQERQNAIDLKIKETIEEVINYIGDVKIGQYSNICMINAKESEKYIRKFKDYYNIDFGFHGLSSDVNFDWTEENIEIAENRFDWQTLSSNTSIIWSFDQLEKYKAKLNWACISSLNLNWTKDKIAYFKNYFVFRGANGSQFRNLLGSDFLNDRLWDFMDKNKVKGNISANEFLEWDIDLIDCYIDLWDWSLLATNKAVKFSSEIIDRYSAYLDFKALCQNENVLWNKMLINKYKDKLDFTSLAKNQSILWDVDLIKDNFDRIDFTSLSQKGKITDEAIVYFEKEWDKEDFKDYSNRDSDGTYWTTVKYTLWEYLCENINIVWNDFLFSKLLHKIPLNILYKSRIKLRVETINLLWNYSRIIPITYYGNNSYETDETKDETFYFKDAIKYCEITDLTIDKFKENEIKWYGVLNDENQLNSSIRSLLKKLNCT